MTRSAISATGLVKHFPPRGRQLRGRPGVRAVDGIDLEVSAGQCLAIVGESGCGKSTTARLLVGLLAPSDGHVYVDGRELPPIGVGPRSDRRLVQLVSQNPWSALNRRKSVRHVLTQPMLVHRLAADRAERNEQARRALVRVGLDEKLLDRRVAELSGGELQRVTVARALAVNPKVLVLDEPTASLDVSVKAVLVNLLNDLRDELGLGYVLITHELDIARHLADRVAVMYLGEFVEVGDVDDVLGAPRHPYTRALVGSALSMDTFGRPPTATSIGEVPSADMMPPGCRFHTRCLHARAQCRQDHPVLERQDDNRLAACLRLAELRELPAAVSAEGKDASS